MHPEISGRARTCAQRDTRPIRAQRGTGLIEALIAFAVLAAGLLAVARLQSHLRLDAELARERSEAIRLAQEEIETLRAFATLPATPGVASFEAIESASRPANADRGDATPTRYTIERAVAAAPGLAAKNVLVTVRWRDRGGAPQETVLGSVIAGIDPTFSGALGLAARDAIAKGAFGRALGIPRVARDLGDGRSVFKPIEGSTLAWLFDNRSGAITGRCTSIDPLVPTRALTAANLLGCEPRSARLLSGVLRFTSAIPPDPAAANETPPALATAFAAAGVPGPVACSVEARKTVAYIADGSLRHDAVPMDAAPASLGLSAWRDTGDRHLAYHCAVEPQPGGGWSGRLAIAPNGWTIGGGAADRRLCRDSADLDRSGAIDTNLEHPARYDAVEGTLAHQNFLVVRGDQNCPAGRAVQVAGNNRDVYVDLSTAAESP